MALFIVTLPREMCCWIDRRQMRRSMQCCLISAWLATILLELVHTQNQDLGIFYWFMYYHLFSSFAYFNVDQSNGWLLNKLR